MHYCFICIGSNTAPIRNLELARKALREFFPDIAFDKEVETDALLFYTNLAPFHNQTGRFYSALDKQEIKSICKQIESRAGRLTEDKGAEIVKLDIDLLQYDDEVLKPEDLARAIAFNAGTV